MGTAAGDIPALKAKYGVGFPGVFENETPQRPVTVADFRMDPSEVTTARFAVWAERRSAARDGDLPATFVTQAAAQGFCRAAGGDLPTEAQWEYAARAGGDVEFPWGDEPPSPARANYSGSGIAAPVPAGRYPPNAFGLYDMAGNVWEWTADAWPGSSDRYGIRGGSYAGAVVNLRTRWRDSHPAGDAVAFVGFRCAYPAGQKD